MRITSIFARLAIVFTMLFSPALAAVAEISEKDFSDAMNKYLSTDAGQKNVGKAVEDFFKNKQQEMMKQKEEAQKAEFEEQFKNPVKIDVGHSPVKGPANAKITIIEFSDFQCPYCKRGKDTVEEVLKAYPNDVKVAFKHFPLPFHKEATPAAKAAVAAQKQGKFWEMHDALFDNQGSLGAAFYTEQAKKLGLNMEQFKKDMEAPETEAAIKADQEAGSKNGIQGTPGFFVGGVAVKGAYPVDYFKQIIDRLLGKTEAPRK